MRATAAILILTDVSFFGILVFLWPQLSARLRRAISIAGSDATAFTQFYPLHFLNVFLVVSALHLALGATWIAGDQDLRQPDGHCWFPDRTRTRSELPISVLFMLPFFHSLFLSCLRILALLRFSHCTIVIPSLSILVATSLISLPPYTDFLQRIPTGGILILIPRLSALLCHSLPV